MSIGNLKASFRLWMRPHKNRDFLSPVRDRLLENFKARVVDLGKPIADDGNVDKIGIDVDDRRSRDKRLLERPRLVLHAI